MSDEFLRPMPCSNDAERAVLSCALQWPDCIGKILSQHGGERLFYIPANRITWNALEKLHRERGEIDLITLTDELRRRGTLDQVGGPAHVAGLLDAVPSTQLLPQYLRSVSEDARRREIIMTCNQVANDAYNPSSKVEDLVQVLDNQTQAVFNAVSQSHTTRHINQVALSAIDTVHNRMEAGGVLPGLSFGIPKLDEMTNGMLPATMIIIAARPALGKTSLALNFGQHVAGQGHPTLIFSAEMLAESLVMRMLSSNSEIDSLQLERGNLMKTDMPKLMNAARRISNLPIWIDDRSHMRLIDIQTTSRRLFKENGIKLIIIDYIQLLQLPTDAYGKEDAVSKLSKGITNLAKDLGIPIIVVAQLNRDPEKRSGGKPKVSDLRDSGQLEQDAHGVLMIHAPNPEDESLILDAEIIVGKWRGGQTGSVPVAFHRPFTTFKPRYAQSQ
jgi:replicative DNA helicase